MFRIFIALFLKISRHFDDFVISWTFLWNSGKISSTSRRKIAEIIEKREWKTKFHFHSGKNLDGFLLKFWDLSGAKECKSCRSRKIKNAAKWLFGCYRSCPYSRERASQSLRVISFIFHSSPWAPSLAALAWRQPLPESFFSFFSCTCKMVSDCLPPL